MRQALKLVLINAAVFAALIVAGIAVLLLIPQQPAEDARTGKEALPNYAGSDWAPKLFEEMRATSTVYYSYIGWRRRPYHGEFVNVVGKYDERLTIEPRQPKNATVFFFGGSTMWGTGSPDSGTIPSQFARLSGLEARNFGETAYTAHQNLEMLIKLLQAGERPQAVVFYDGVNEVVHKCRTELGPYSDANESRTRVAVESSGFYRFFWNLIGELSTFFSERQQLEGYDCASDPKKAQAVAEALVSDWKIAQATAAVYGAKFYAFLQPVVYFSHTRTDYLDAGPNDAFSQQFQAVYPRIRAAMAGTPFLDLTDALDRDEPIYIDFCHVSPNGNEMVAQRFVDVITPVGGQNGR
jgi:hypothetical protein